MDTFLRIYERLTRPRLKITVYRKEENGDTIIFYCEVTIKGKKPAKSCKAEIRVNNYRYNGLWKRSWEEKQDIPISEELQLFSINKVQKTITFPIGYERPIMDKPLSDYIDKNLKIVVTSENADSASDEKTISDIMQSAVEVSSN